MSTYWIVGHEKIKATRCKRCGIMHKDYGSPCTVDPPKRSDDPLAKGEHKRHLQKILSHPWVAAWLDGSSAQGRSVLEQRLFDAAADLDGKS